MSLSPIALEALRAAQSAFTKSQADVFEDALARGMEALDREGRLVGAFAAAELDRLRERVAELEKANAGLDDLRIRAFDKNIELRAQLDSARVDGQRLARAEQRRAELEAVLGTHRKDDQAEIERLRKQVTDLLAERHSTNESLDDAVQELRACRDDKSAERSADRLTRLLAPTKALQVDEPAEPEPTLLRWGLNDVLWGDDDTVTVLLSGRRGEPYWLELDKERAAVLLADLAGPDGLTVFRASHDSIVMGQYTTRAVARKHCETVLRREVGDEVWLGWVPDHGGEDAPEELCFGEDVECSGYYVTPLEVASAYDEEAEE